jgi:hypothetical protein
MPMDPWLANPTFEEYLDGFNESILSTRKWGSPVLNGATIIAPSGGFLHVQNVGGAAGISYLPSKYAEYGKNCRMSVSIALATGSVAGDGGHAEASLVIYKDANNWIRYGPYRDTASGINNRAYLRMKVNGTLIITAIDISICDTDSYVFTVSQTGLDIVFHLNGVRATSFEWPELIGFSAWLEAGTTGAGQKIDAEFDDFEVQHSYDPLFVTVGALIRAIYEQLPVDTASVWDELKSAHTIPNTFGDYLDAKLSTLSVDVAAVWDELKSAHTIPNSFGDYLDKAISSITSGDTFTAVSGSFSLPSTTAVALEFLAATYGTVFRPVLSFNVVGPMLDYCYLYSSAAYTDLTSAANNLSTGDVPLVAASGAAANDVIIFGRTALHHRLNCVVSNGPFNSDNVFDWVYWDGAAWQLLVGVTDGTRNDTVVHDCETAWSELAGTGVTASTDNADYKVGTKSAKFAITAAATAGEILATAAIASKDISSYTYLDVWIKCSVGTNAGDLQILLDDTASCASPLESLNVPALSANTWTRVNLKLATPLNNTAIISVGLKQVVDIGACTIWIDDVRAVTREFSQDGTVTWTTDVTSQTLNGHAAYYVGARIKSLGTSRPIGSYFSIATDAETDFDARALFGSYLYIEVYRKIGASYPIRPDDVMIFQQSNLRKNPNVDVLCYSDTKVVFTLSATPTSAITVPYQGTVETLKP